MVMPWAANQTEARCQNAAAVTACSSWWISENARRVRSSRGGVDGPVADCRASRPAPGRSRDPPAATGGDAGELVDVDVDQLARPVALIATWRINVGGAVAMVEPAKALSVQDRLHRRGSQAELVTDVGCTPPMRAARGWEECVDLAGDVALEFSWSSPSCEKLFAAVA